MTLNRPMYIWPAALLVMVFSSVNADAGGTVEKISEAALDELIYTDKNKIVVTFMAAWCGPCIDELPALNKLHHKYKGRGFKLIGVSIDYEGPQAMQPIIDKLKVDFPVYWFGETAIQKYSIYAIPMIMWVKNGRIVEKQPGRRSQKELDKKIRRFLGL
ncbi:MAG: TlpA family protein disulfide reductase [Desulfobacterales bacterium]|nr:TlpA family protein disulfide reductase [Desulfobacterales bacterium]